MDRLPFTGDDAADRLLVEEPLALLIGFALDQQVTVQKAFSGPRRAEAQARPSGRREDRGDRSREARRRLPRAPGAPPIPGIDGRQGPAAVRGDRDATTATTPRRIWTEAADGPDLERRLLALPGIGEMKAKSIIAILGKRLGVALPGMDEVMPTHPTLGDVDSAEALAAYQAGKRAKKAALSGRERLTGPSLAGPLSHPGHETTPGRPGSFACA